MKKVFSFVKGKRGDDKRDSKVNPPVSVEITNPSGQKITSDDEHIVGLQQGYGYCIDLNGKDKALPKLHRAVWTANLEKVKVHAKKFDVNSTDPFNRTPLHLAVAQGHTEIAWYLLNNNASMDAIDSEGLTPFLKAIECGNKDCVNLLIECGVNVTCTDRNGNNGLHLASKLGFYNIASLLLKEGVNLDLANNVGEFPLHIATGCEHRELVELLLRSGGNVEVLDRERRTPLMIAARSGYYSIIKVLLDSGASLDTSDSNGWTAEDYAQFGGHQDLVEILKSGQKEESSTAQEQSDRLSVQSSDTSENVPQPPSQPQVIIKSEPEQLCNNEEQQDSPRSCVTPPALEPPRSWDLIQSGAIDQGVENRRRNFMSLGPLRSHQEVLDGATDPAKGELSPMMLPSPTGDQLSLENRLSPVPFGSGLPTPERRTRSPLERANSLDLPSDQDSPIQLGSNGGGYSPDEALPVFNDLWEPEPKRETNGEGDAAPTIISETNDKPQENRGENHLRESNNNLNGLDNEPKLLSPGVKGHENGSPQEEINGIVPEDCITNQNYKMLMIVEKEAANDILLDESRNNDLTSTDKLSSTEMSDSFDNLDEKSSGTDNPYAGGGGGGVTCSLDRLDEVQASKKMSIEIIQSTGKLDDTLSICTVPLKAKFRESHSLDILEVVDSSDEVTRSSARGKKHSRNKSITLSGQPQLWKSVDALPKSNPMGGSDIDAQLLCYDEALRQLANVNVGKQTQPEPQANTSAEDNKQAVDARPEEKIDLALPSAIEKEDFIDVDTCLDIAPEPAPPVQEPEIYRIENEPLSLEMDKDEAFPPPPKCFMENEDDISHLNSIEILNSTLPMSKLTPIKENYLELDSLTSNTDAQDSDNTENSVSKFESTPCHFDVKVIVNNINNNSHNYSISNVCEPNGFSSGITYSMNNELDNLSESNTLENVDDRNSTPTTTEYNDLEILKANDDSSPNIVSCHLDGGDLFLTDQVLPEYYDRYFVDVKTLRLKPSQVDIDKIVLPPDSPSPKAPPRHHKIRKGSSEAHLETSSSSPENDDRQLAKCSSLDFDIGGICNVTSKTCALIQIDKSDSESECQSRPLKNKRKILAAMRSPGGDRKNNVVGSSEEKFDEQQKEAIVNIQVPGEDEEDDDDESGEDDPPFWQTTEKGGHFTRQETVVSVTTIHSSKTTLTPRNTLVTNSASEAGPSTDKRDGEKDSSSPSSEAETASVADTPKHCYTPKVLQAHLREANLEKGRLEETAASLREKAERLKYELEDAKQAEIARDDTIAILQTQLKRLEDRYTQAQEDLCTLRQRATNAEQELQHLRQLCSTLREEKEELCRELAKHTHCQTNNKEQKIDKVVLQDMEANEDIINKMKMLEKEKHHEEEKNKHLVLHLEEVLITNQNMVSEREALIAQNIADVKKLQEDTLCWKERYEECAAKLELMDKRQDPRLIEAQDTIATLKRTISILQQEKASHAKLIDASTSTLSPFKKSCLLTQEDTDSVDKDKYRYECSTVKIMQELNTLRQQLETCLPLQQNQDNIEPTQKMIIDLQQKLEIEIGKRYALDLQVNRLLKELQEKMDLEAELGRLSRRLERDFVSKEEFERVTNRQDEAIGRIQQQALCDSESRFSEKLAEIDRLLQHQIKEHARLDKIRTEAEISMKQELEDTRQKLQTALSKAQMKFIASEAEVELLKNKCEQLAKEIKKLQDLRRKSLIEKSYSINLSDLSPSRSGNNATLVDLSMSLTDNSQGNSSDLYREKLDRNIKKHLSGSESQKKDHEEISMEDKFAEELKNKYLKK